MVLVGSLHFGGFMLSALVILLPETARNVVGNGSFKDSLWNQSTRRLLQARRQRHQDEKLRSNDGEDEASNGASRTSGIEARPANDERAVPKLTRTFKVKSPLAAIRILSFKDTPFVIWLSSSY